MKSLLLIVVAVMTLASFTVQNESKKNVAEVNRYENYYLFMQCKPIKDYTVIGTIKQAGGMWSGTPKQMFDVLIKRAKQEYPNCDGIVFEDVTLQHASCIKFKE